MSKSRMVLIRDCLAIAAILLCVASAAAQAQVLASYQLCSVSEHGTCVQDQERPCQLAARGPSDAWLQWAVAMHRKGLSDAGVALRTVKPPTAPVDTASDVSEVSRSIACSH